MSKFIVRRTGYKTLSKDALASFAENVWSRMSTMPEYKDFAVDVALLSEKLQLYKESLAQAVNGGVDRITLKNARQEGLFKVLDRIGNGLNDAYTGDNTWIVNSGMEVQHERSTTTTPIDPPFALRADLNGVAGQVNLTFKVIDRSRVRSNAIEYSNDGGTTWKNGQYTSATRFLMMELPARMDTLIRVRSLGSAGRQSAWSKPVGVFVP